MTKLRVWNLDIKADSDTYSVISKATENDAEEEIETNILDPSRDDCDVTYGDKKIVGSAKKLSFDTILSVKT